MVALKERYRRVEGVQEIHLQVSWSRRERSRIRLSKARVRRSLRGRELRHNGNRCCALRAFFHPRTSRAEKSVSLLKASIPLIEGRDPGVLVVCIPITDFIGSLIGHM